MKKQIILIVIIIALLAVFFFPKDAGGTCGFCPSPPTVHRTEYGCIGIKQDINPPPSCADCGIDIVCFGIVTSELQCYTYYNNDPTEVACK